MSQRNQGAGSFAGMSKEDRREYFRALGRKGGRRKTPDKRRAAQLNGLKPAKGDVPRGRPRKDA